MKRDKMRGELRRLRRENERLREDRDTYLEMSHFFLVERYRSDSPNAGVKVFQRKFRICQFKDIPEERVKEMALWDFERQLLDMLRKSGLIKQERKGNYIRTRIKYRLS